MRGDFWRREQDVVDKYFHEEKVDERRVLKVTVGWDVVKFGGDTSELELVGSKNGESAWVVPVSAQMIQELDILFIGTGQFHPLFWSLEDELDESSDGIHFSADHWFVLIWFDIVTYLSFGEE